MEYENLEQLKRDFEKKEGWGLLASIDLHGCDPETIRSAEHIKRYVVGLCDRIKMKRFGEPTIVDFGEDPKVTGYSLAQLIETSLISGHFANESNAVYMDIFSCKFYDPWDAAEFTKEFFRAKDYNMNLVIRK